MKCQKCGSEDLHIGSFCCLTCARARIDQLEQQIGRIINENVALDTLLKSGLVDYSCQPGDEIDQLRKELNEARTDPLYWSRFNTAGGE